MSRSSAPAAARAPRTSSRRRTGKRPALPDLDSAPVAAPITVYTTRWCGHCRRLARQLAEAGIEAPMVDIDRTEHAHHGRRIEQQTGGYRVVPTVKVGERLLVNPTAAEVTEAVAESAPPSPK